MTASRYHAAPLRSRRRPTADRIVSAGLATAACVGLVGVIGVRGMEHSAAAVAPTDSSTLADAPRSSTGLTEVQLDAYAGQLQAEAAKLDAYRAKLAQAARTLKASARSQVASQVGGTPNATTRTALTAAPTPVAKPAPTPVAKPAPRPQSQTKSS